MQNQCKFGVSILATLVTASFGLAMSSGLVQAQAGKSIAGFDNICLTEARRAEAQHGIPNGLLQSISRVEAGRKTVTGEFMPWAWTLNDRGDGLFFDSREAAMRHLQEAVDTGDHSVDVGCMQVNTKWHMGGFHELGDMLDPVQNADYAAGFLLDLHEAHQSWDEAVKHYHSAVPEKHVVYHRRVLAELEMFLNGDHQDIAVVADPTGAGEPGDDSAESRAEDRAKDRAKDRAGELALRTPVHPVAVPAIAEPRPASVLPSTISSDPVPPTTMPTPTVGPMDKQPNLAPHWNRVKHFRRLLAQGAG